MLFCHCSAGQPLCTVRCLAGPSSAAGSGRKAPVQLKSYSWNRDLLFSTVLFLYVLWVEGLGLRRVLLVFQFGCWEKPYSMEISPQSCSLHLAGPHQFGRQRVGEQHVLGMLGPRGPRPQQQYFTPAPLVAVGKRRRVNVSYVNQLYIIWRVAALGSFLLSH